MVVAAAVAALVALVALAVQMALRMKVQEVEMVELDYDIP